MSRPTLTPAQIGKSHYSPGPELVDTRAADLPGLTSIKVAELFPDTPDPIPAQTPDELRRIIRNRTRAALKPIDLDKIQPGDSVNILTSHHGFSLYGGHAYAEMVRTIRDEIESRCRTSDIRLLSGVGLRFRETEEYIKRFELDEYFQGRAEGIAPVDRGVPIQTAIGTLYGIAKAYNARWIVHAHNNDLRELHYHRQLGRLFKPFAMSYATIETRSSYHQSMGPRSANLLPRMIYDSEFVQDKFTFSCILQVGPPGIIGIDASNDLVEQDRRFTRLNLNLYGKIITLLGSLKKAILIIDYPGPIPYTTAGGILFGNFLNANVDEFDLSRPFTPFTRYTDMLYTDDKVLAGEDLPPPNPAIKALILNCCNKGYPSTFFAQQLSTLAVGAQADFLADCEQNTRFMNYAVKVENLRKAVKFAKRFAGTENILAFDGAVGGFNVSESMADELLRLAPQISKQVDKDLMAKWLKQRGIGASTQ
jgi:hypothetical protein